MLSVDLVWTVLIYPLSPAGTAYTDAADVGLCFAAFHAALMLFLLQLPSWNPVAVVCLISIEVRLSLGLSMRASERHDRGNTDSDRKAGPLASCLQKATLRQLWQLLPRINSCDQPLKYLL